MIFILEMVIDGGKILRIIEHYGEIKGYPKKSHLKGFTDDFGVNYAQWSNYTRGDQNLGIKIIDFLVEKFPNLNMNWLLKDEGDMFVNNSALPQLTEPGATYEVKDPVLHKLELMHQDIKKLQEMHKVSHN